MAPLNVNIYCDDSCYGGSNKSIHHIHLKYRRRFISLCQRLWTYDILENKRKRKSLGRDRESRRRGGDY
jgi:hypothetical protein